MSDALEVAQAAGLKKTLVWTNADPDSDFVLPQSIRWDRDPDTKFIVVETSGGTTLISPEQATFMLQEYNVVPGNTTQNMFLYIRLGKLVDTGIDFESQFGRCYEGMIGSAGSTRVQLENYRCVPVKVYELK